MKQRGRAGGQLRVALAQAAARLLAEGAAATLASARQKAAERLGVSDSRALPSNQEITEALADYQRLFGGEQFERRLTQLRRTALSAMRLLEGFSPRLVGPVLSGTAGAEAHVTLHLFCDQTESVGLFLLERGIPHRLRERSLGSEPGLAASHPVYAFLAGDIAVELVVFPALGLRQAPPSAIDGRPMARADRRALEALLEDAGAGREPEQGPP